MRGQVLLTQALPTGLDEKKGGEKLEREKEGERKEEILERVAPTSL